MNPLHERQVRQVGERLVEDPELGEAQVALLREAVERVEGDPARDCLSGELLDLAADPVVDVLEDAHRELRPGVAGQYRRNEAGIELRRRLGPVRLFDPRQRDRLVAGQVLRRHEQLEVQPPEGQRLGIDAQVLVVDLPRDQVVTLIVRRARRRHVGVARLQERHAQIDRHPAVGLQRRLQIQLRQRAVIGDLDQRPIAESRLQLADREPKVAQARRC